MNHSITGLLSALMLIAALSPIASATDNEAPTSVAKKLQELVPAVRKEKKLVGLAAMVMKNGQVIAKAVDGKRQLGTDNKLEIGDRWHVGSITKSMTATMIARLVEQGKLKWTTSVGECFGDELKMNDGWKDVTFEELLTHRSGAPANFSLAIRLQKPKAGKERMAARKKAVAEIVAEKPQSEPGKKFAYSNVGFTIAGAMAEKKTGKAWEDLVRAELFARLESKGAGFGPPKSTKGKIDQPRGHQNLGFIKVPAAEDADNTPIMGPAGTVHMTLLDLCSFGNEHLVGERGEGKLLKAETYKRLHTGMLGNYAYGWVAPKQNPWTDGHIVWHNGSNTLWYALLALLPDQDMVVAVTSNDGDLRKAESGAFEIVKEISAAAK